ncbi:Mitochondrial distribution and morphology protein 10 [Naganishia cerealis]|uniref:Mitochondrial distribution and morphology protein 10 n=1 Tax=Naganishia cerealis TaxID=610337 RepID=A0ACC2WEU8_9TREE|nr:Mitochondrial distribution and morphology protein 10 [Naganishia cerealis]
MYTYMEYLQKCFFHATRWNEDNIYSNITASSHALLEFLVPSGLKMDVSSRSSPNLASSFTLSNHHSLNGSLAYMYSSTQLKGTPGTRRIPLQDAIAGFKIVEPNEMRPSASGTIAPSSLLYGRMYFPGAALEAMVIRRFSPHTQLLIKCIHNPQLDKNGTLIAYFQKNTQRYSREVIYSTNDALVGFRGLYNIGSTPSWSPSPPNFDRSVVSVGAELWYAARTMSPGLSTGLRYSTRSTSTGKPLTMTLACNPILGHISSTYTVKTSVASTFCSRYDFNLFSYASNLSLGFELFNFDKNAAVERNPQLPTPTTNPSASKQNLINPIRDHSYYQTTPSTNATTYQSSQTISDSFQKLVNRSEFSSVVKVSTSLNDRLVRLLWEGRFKDFLVSSGVKVSLNPATNAVELNRFGISFSYAS